MMYWLTLGLLAALSAVTNGDSCNKYVNGACGKVGISDQIVNCSSKYSGAHHAFSNLQQYATVHLEQNFKYLLMSAYFNSYKANREGFGKLYRKLADDTWDDALDLVKYLAKRGSKFEFDYIPEKEQVKIASYEMAELESLSVALDMHKSLAVKAHEIHSKVSSKDTNHHGEVRDYHDAETMHYIQEKFVTKHASNIRDLAGYTNDLHDLIKAAKQDPSLAIYLFDEHLKKVVE